MKFLYQIYEIVNTNLQHIILYPYSNACVYSIVNTSVSSPCNSFLVTTEIPQYPHCSISVVFWGHNWRYLTAVTNYTHQCDAVDYSLAGYIFTHLWLVKIESPAREHLAISHS